MEKEFLPIGTVVLLKEATKKIMITGFCVTPEEDQEKMYDYAGCLYPEGYITQDQTCLFDHNQIDKISHLGFVDEEEKEFKNKLNLILKNMEEEIIDL